MQQLIENAFSDYDFKAHYALDFTRGFLSFAGIKREFEKATQEYEYGAKKNYVAYIAAQTIIRLKDENQAFLSGLEARLRIHESKKHFCQKVHDFCTHYSRNIL